MASRRALDPQTALVLADLDGPGVAQVADMSPADARRHIEHFVRKWDLHPKPPIGAVENLTLEGQEIAARLYRPSVANRRAGRHPSWPAQRRPPPVMPGLVPGIHVLRHRGASGERTRRRRDMDARNKSGHDGRSGASLSPVKLSV